MQCTVGKKCNVIRSPENPNVTIPNSVKNENDSPIRDMATNEVFAWSDESTRLFLSLYKEKQELLMTRKIKTKKVLWEQIADIMHANGYNVTVIQVENKFKTLERAYKNMITNNKQTGRGRSSCPYETELTELLHHKHSIEPLALSGSQGLVLRTKEASTSQSLCDINGESARSSSPEVTADYCNQGNENSAIENSINEMSTNTNNHTRKGKMGTTARFLDSCQKSMEKLLNDLKKEKNLKAVVQQQILMEYRQMRISYDNSMKETLKQLRVANKLRQERNELLRELIILSKIDK